MKYMAKKGINRIKAAWAMRFLLSQNLTQRIAN
mgnify:CR=1 FL=1